MIGQWTPVTDPPPENNTLPPAVVTDLHYDYTKNVLVAGTLGREPGFTAPGRPSQPLAGLRAKDLEPAFTVDVALPRGTQRGSTPVSLPPFT
jgi:hypothetical protein